MCRNDSLYGLQLDDGPTLDDHARSETLVDPFALKLNRDGNLPLHRKPVPQ